VEACLRATGTGRRNSNSRKVRLTESFRRAYFGCTHPTTRGWYRTGDIGALDAAGNLYFKGRKKEVIVTPGGTNVYPEDLEAALRRQPEVKGLRGGGNRARGNAEPCAVLILRGAEKSKTRRHRRRDWKR
jgi:acyl-CoA synthetase (AMP-forming)/AMP-acid ligase II